MNDIIRQTPPAIVGGMGGQMDDNHLGGSLYDNQLGITAEQGQAGLEVGVIEDKVGFRVVTATGDPIVLLFTVNEMYNIMAAQEMAIQHIRTAQRAMVG